MRDWIGAIIASITVVAALVINPASFYHGDIVTTKVVFAGVLLSSAGAAFLLAKEIHELSFSRHVTFWIVGLAVVAIGATNMDVLTGTAKIPKIVTKQTTPEQTRKNTPNRDAAEVYVPDTLRINRVEKLVTQDPNATSQDEEGQLIKSTSSSRDSELPKDWKLSDEQKEKFERFLARKGLKFDPKTAFQRPRDPNAPKSSPASTSKASEQKPSSNN